MSSREGRNNIGYSTGLSLFWDPNSAMARCCRILIFTRDLALAVSRFKDGTRDNANNSSSSEAFSFFGSGSSRISSETQIQVSLSCNLLPHSQKELENDFTKNVSEKHSQNADDCHVESFKNHKTHSHLWSGSNCVYWGWALVRSTESLLCWCYTKRGFLKDFHWQMHFVLSPVHRKNNLCYFPRLFRKLLF